jgi:hypothetical protein
MKICPIAIAVGCPKCAAFKVCPAKSLLGGYVEPAPAKPAAGDSKGGHAKR